ncbi:hypothetical protein [Kitasatospora sp. NPDC004272]
MDDESIERTSDRQGAGELGQPGSAGHRPDTGPKEHRESSLIWATWANTFTVMAIGVVELLIK